mgnify:CR=1 FL=1
MGFPGTTGKVKKSIEGYDLLRSGDFPPWFTRVVGNFYNNPQEAQKVLDDIKFTEIGPMGPHPQGSVFAPDKTRNLAKLLRKGRESVGEFMDTRLGKAVKPVLKAGVKALPFVGYGAAAKGAVDYGAEHPFLSTISGASAIPGFGDVFGIPLLAAELGGLVINRDLEVMRERKKKRGLLDYEEPKRYRAFNRLRD